MSVLDLDFYKLTMLQFIWKHYAEVPVVFQLHSRNQDLRDIVNPYELSNKCMDYTENWLREAEANYLLDHGVFEKDFISDLSRLFGKQEMPFPNIEASGNVSVTGKWFEVTLWETVILSAVSQQYSTDGLPDKSNVEGPDFIKRFADIYAIGQSGARWADFGTRRRWSRGDHAMLIEDLAGARIGEQHGFIGTSNVHLARTCNVRPIGTYAHELEMVLRPLFPNETATTRNVLTKWQEMYPRELRIALTDTYTTPKFLEEHGRFLLDNDWRGVRLDSGNPVEIGKQVDEWLSKNRPAHMPLLDVVFSDGLDANQIIHLQNTFAQNKGHPATFINPLYGWGTGLTNPNSDLSLVMKVVRTGVVPTYKITDDSDKSIR